MTAFEQAKLLGVQIKSIPSWAPMAGITLLGKYVCIAKGFEDREDLVAHELVHVEQQRAAGSKFYFNYLFRPHERAKYEAEAYAVQIWEYRTWTIEEAAEAMSGPLYLHMCSYDQAMALLKALAPADIHVA